MRQNADIFSILFSWKNFIELSLNIHDEKV